MNKFDEVMKNILLISFGIVAVCGVLIFSYINSKDIGLKDIFDGENFHIGWEVDHFFDELDDFTVDIGNSFSSYKTVDKYEDTTVSTVNNIEIHTSIEDIRFVHENRDDIRIVLERQVPDTNLYKLDYSVNSTGNTLIVRSELRHNTIHTDRDYQGTITFYVPEDYECEELVIDSAIATDTIQLPKYVEDLDIHVNFGNPDIEITEAMNRVKMTVNAGDMTLKAYAPIGEIKASVDAGELTVKSSDEVGSVYLDNSMATIKADFSKAPAVMEVNSSMGDVKPTFDTQVHSLTADLSLGDLNIDVVSQDQGVIYLNTDLVDVKSILDRTYDKSNANIFIDMNLGSVKIH